MTKLLKSLKFGFLTLVAVGSLAGLITSGILVAQTSFFEVPGGGLLMRTFDPIVRFAGNLTFQDSTGTQMAELSERNALHLVEASTAPATGDLSSSAEAAVQVCNDTLVVAYNNAGTTTFLTIDLDGSDTSWAQATEPPATCGYSW